MASIIIKDLKIGYKSSILNTDLNIKIREGQYVLILGENGSGKSTLVSTILGLVDPLSGRVVFEDLTKDDIGYLPQSSPISKDFPATAYEVVISGNKPNFLPFYSRKEKNKTLEIMKELGISSLKDRRFSSLSGGQKQRVLLARALVRDKKFLILDEPVTGLDPEASQHMYDLVRKINKSGRGIIMISHDQERASRDASHILKLESGVAIYSEVETHV